jgi:hypothetical protein
MKTAKATETAGLKSLHDRRQDIVRELERINREIAEAQQQLARLDARRAVLAQPGQAAA